MANGSQAVSASPLHNRPIIFTYVLISLVTIAFVVGLTRTVSNRVFPYNATITLGSNEQCVKNRYNLTDPSDYNWNLENGSSLFIPADQGWCPTREAIVLTGNISAVCPDVFEYADMGVTVHSSAIGAPITIYSPVQSDNLELNSLLELYGSSVINTTQCVPVMQKNPISCHRGGTVQVNGYMKTIAAESDDGLCSYNMTQLSNPASGVGAMIMKICKNGDVGQVTIVLGAFWEFSKSLVGSIGDSDFFNSPDSSSYVVSCSRHSFMSVFEHFRKDFV